MPMTDYLITQVNFSYRQDVESKLDDVESKPTGAGKRTTTLVGHISFKYKGFHNAEEYGTVLVDLQPLTEIAYDKDGKYTSLTITDLKYKDWSSIESIAKAAVEKEITSLKNAAAERDSYMKAMGVISTIEVPTETTMSGRVVEDEVFGFASRDNVLII